MTKTTSLIDPMVDRLAASTVEEQQMWMGHHVGAALNCDEQALRGLSAALT